MRVEVLSTVQAPRRLSKIPNPEGPIGRLDPAETRFADDGMTSDERQMPPVQMPLVRPPPFIPRVFPGL